MSPDQMTDIERELRWSLREQNKSLRAAYTGYGKAMQKGALIPEDQLCLLCSEGGSPLNAMGPFSCQQCRVGCKPL